MSALTGLYFRHTFLAGLGQEVKKFFGFFLSKYWPSASTMENVLDIKTGSGHGPNFFFTAIVSVRDSG
jgi:hypothetical protein